MAVGQARVSCETHVTARTPHLAGTSQEKGRNNAPNISAHLALRVAHTALMTHTTHAHTDSKRWYAFMCSRPPLGALDRPTHAPPTASVDTERGAHPRCRSPAQPSWGSSRGAEREGRLGGGRRTGPARTGPREHHSARGAGCAMGRTTLVPNIDPPMIVVRAAPHVSLCQPPVRTEWGHGPLGASPRPPDARPGGEETFTRRGARVAYARGLALRSRRGRDMRMRTGPWHRVLVRVLARCLGLVCVGEAAAVSRPSVVDAVATI